MIHLKLENLFLKKFTSKKPCFKKLGILGAIGLFGAAAFMCGELVHANATSSAGILPVSKGGTGLNFFPENQVLVGNENNTLISREITNSVSSNSTKDQLPSAKGVFDTYKNVGQAINLSISPKGGAYFFFYTRYSGDFYGFYLPDGNIFGFVSIDYVFKLANVRGWQNQIIFTLPTGYALAKPIQTPGQVFATGTSGSAYLLWSENDNIDGSTALLRSWDNNYSVPRNSEIRLLYNFPCLIKKV
ncbi:MAG: hypothetical protein LBT91_01915 [Bifidobacteriaceae bacterium]|jgi:hypothetical protein|nr:hypothetical protein [Bifidobacteriaceae bacterium]